jgi:hypothetical protein
MPLQLRPASRQVGPALRQLRYKPILKPAQPGHKKTRNPQLAPKDTGIVKRFINYKATIHSDNYTLQKHFVHKKIHFFLKNMCRY